MTIETRSLQPFGAEILGVSIAEPPTGIAGEIIDAVSHHRVVVFRHQTACSVDLVQFLRTMGELMLTAGETPVAGAADLNLVSNVGRSTPPRSVFHTDTSYVAAPPAFSALQVVTLPAAGGETLFSDQVAAAAALPTRVHEWLRGRTLMHRSTMADGTRVEARHPLLRRHPVTGATSLFLSTPERCSALDGIDEARSARIVALLYRRSIRPAGLYRHTWGVGDIVIWDNRTTMHRAEHNGVIGDRVLHRGLVAGEVSIPA